MLSEIYFFKHSSKKWLMRLGDYTAFLFRYNLPELFWKTGILEIKNGKRKLLKIYAKPVKGTTNGVH